MNFSVNPIVKSFITLMCLMSALCGCAVITGVNSDNSNPSALHDVYSADEQDALLQLTRTCEQGGGIACNQLGSSYARGINGAELNFEKAGQWYLRAADLGLIAAQLNLADLYAENKILPPDDVEAFKWITIAEVLAGECRDEDVKGSINPQQVNSMPSRELCNIFLRGIHSTKSKLGLRVPQQDKTTAAKRAQQWLNKHRLTR